MRKGYYLVFCLFLICSFACVIVFSRVKTQPQLSPPELIISTGTFAQGDSIYSCLVEKGVPPQDIIYLEKTLSPIFDINKCYPGDTYEVTVSSKGTLEVFKYYSGPLDCYVVERSTAGMFVARREKIPLEKRLVGLVGTVEGSLYESMIRLGQFSELAMKFSDIFAWQIDFFTDTQAGDRFKLIWERFYRDGKEFCDGRILVAQYSGRNGNHTGIFFENSDGKSGYYDLQGQSLRKGFLRSPLNYRRISSRFSYKRFHPILKYPRPHLGIDYAAPYGTPVVSIGDGVVTYAGWKEDYGKFVKIRHSNGYHSTYGHLSRFGKGIVKGARVKQGQVIGYVGATGLATGPHLDFRLIKDGRFINFLKLQIPPLESVKEEEREKFERTKKQALYQIATLTWSVSFPCEVHPIVR